MVVAAYKDQMVELAGDFLEAFCWPPTCVEDVDDSLCYHSRQYLEALSRQDTTTLMPLNKVLNQLEMTYSSTKVVQSGFPYDFEKFIRDSVDMQASPGWPWRSQYPTNKDLFKFDGVRCDPLQVAMVEAAVKTRWQELMEKPVADPIYCFIKPEPHKVSKKNKKAWRLISGVGLTDTLVDRILYGNWLDKAILKWPEIPSKAGWTPSLGGYLWMSRAFRGKQPLSVDKSSWDWTVGAWHVEVIRGLVPRMIVRHTDEWRTVFNNRIDAMFVAGNPVFKLRCKCRFTQLVTGIMKSGCLGTIGFNSILQYADHIAIGGDPDDVFFSLGDDTAQEDVGDVEGYIAKLSKTGCLVKEYEQGFPIVFGGHKFDEKGCVPAYRQKHMFNLYHLAPKFALETLDSYQHLYALDPDMLQFIQKLILDMFGPEKILSVEYLEDWYKSLE